jgi:hypothetical protein
VKDYISTPPDVPIVFTAGAARVADVESVARLALGRGAFPAAAAPLGFLGGHEDFFELPLEEVVVGPVRAVFAEVDGLTGLILIGASIEAL